MADEIRAQNSTEQNIHRKERRERKAAAEYKQRIQYELHHLFTERDFLLVLFGK